MDTTLRGPSPLTDQLRLRRAELRESPAALEQAVAAPLLGGPAQWAERVHVALVELHADLREHARLTEGPSGVYAAVLAAAPRLTHAVARLVHEHEQLVAAVADLVRDLEGALGAPHVPGPLDVEAVRARATELLTQLARHCQRGTDLVYEADAVDIGGET